MDNLITVDESLLRWRIGRVEDDFERLSLQYTLAVQMGRRRKRRVK